MGRVIGSCLHDGENMRMSVKNLVFGLGLLYIIPLHSIENEPIFNQQFMEMRSPLGIARMRANLRLSRSRGKIRKRQCLLRGRTFICSPEMLMTSRRFDLMAKYIYAKCYDIGVKSYWPTEIYLAHLGVWVDWQDGLSQKYGPESFLTAFNAVLDSVKKDGFDCDRAPIAYGDGDILDGAHRVTSCLLYGYDVKCRVVSHRRARATSFFFRDFKRFCSSGLGTPYLDAMALQYCYLKQNTRIVLWSPLIQGDIDFKGLLDKKGIDIIYAKPVALTKEALRNLIDFHRYGLGDFGNIDENIKDGVWQGYAMLVVLDKTQEEEFMCYLSDQISPINGLYSKDYNEARSLAKIFFNKNSIGFLNQMGAKRLPGFDEYVEKLKVHCMAQGIDSDELCIVSDITKTPSQWNKAYQLDIAIHGYHKNKANFSQSEFFNVVNKDLTADIAAIDDIIFDPRKHFYYQGIKCAVAV